jgi:hypothetical protein
VSSLTIFYVTKVKLCDMTLGLPVGIQGFLSLY